MAWREQPVTCNHAVQIFLFFIVHFHWFMLIAALISSYDPLGKFSLESTQEELLCFSHALQTCCVHHNSIHAAKA